MICKQCKGKMICSNSRALDNVRYRRYTCANCHSEICTEEREINYELGRSNIAYCSTLSIKLRKGGVEDQL